MGFVTRFIVACTLLQPLVSGSDLVAPLEIRNGDVCQTGIYGELVPIIQSYPAAQQFCSKAYPPQCASGKPKAYAARAIPSPTKTPYTTVTQSDPHPSAWNKVLKQGLKAVSTICSCIQDHKPCTTTSSTTTTTKSSTTTTPSTTTTTTTTTTPLTTATTTSTSSSTTSSSTTTSSSSTTTSSSSTTTSSSSTTTSSSSTTTSSSSTTTSSSSTTTFSSSTTTSSLSTTTSSSSTTTSSSSTTTSSLSTTTSSSSTTTSSSSSSSSSTTTFTITTSASPVPTCSLLGLQGFTIQAVDASGNIYSLSRVNQGTYFSINIVAGGGAGDTYYIRGTDLGYCSGASAFIMDTDSNSLAQVYLDPDGSLFGPVVVATRTGNQLTLASEFRTIIQSCSNILRIGATLGSGCTALTLTATNV